ncbi:MAG: diguanylate cyclase (GGDEF)-like protein/PAS domain S-box-containing protein [Sulfurimonas sp.]|jgi:diguanylate cyclase (GGDEF)-like protein/PAS domain S-box-containing protein
MFIRFYFIFFMLFSLQLFAQPLVNKTTQIELTKDEKVWLSKHPVIRVGMDPDYAPYGWVDKEGKHIGITVDYMHKIEKILGLHFEVVNDKAWDELLGMAKKNELDMISSIVKTPERSEYLSFTETYRDTPTIIIDNGIGTFIGSLKQLSGKRVSVEKGYFMEEFLKNDYFKINVITARNTKEALIMVADGVTDAYVGDANVADYTIKTNDFDTLRFSGQTEYISHQSFAITKGNETLVTILNKAIARIPKNESNSIFNRWLNIEDGISRKTLIKYILLASILFLIVAYWIYRLKYEINNRKDIETKLQKSEALYRHLAEDMVDVTWRTDSDFNFTYLSPSVKRKIGFTAEELIGHKIFEIFTQEGMATSIQRMKQREEDEKKGLHVEHSTLEIEHKCKDGSCIWVEVVTNPEFDKKKNIIGYHGISRDITERIKMQKEINELAFYDPLTKLANRRLLHDRLKQIITSSKRSKKYAGIIYLDLDNFKAINDTYGHAIGDLLLIEAARRLKSCVRDMDTVARVGGDEFVIIVNELEKEKEKSIFELNVIAEKILCALSATYLLEMKSNNNLKIEYQCTASIGATLFKEDEESVESLFERADAVMYEAKDAGRNTIRFYSSGE